MAQRIVETIVGRLITDEQFRTAFLAAPETTLGEMCDRGFELTRSEVAALVNTDPSLWAAAAERLDSRLQKATLINPTSSQKESEHHV